MNVDDDLAADRNKQNVKSAFHIVTGNGARQLASNGLALTDKCLKESNLKSLFAIKTHSIYALTNPTDRQHSD